ncbi:MAG: transposase [Pseudomonadota bacterium]
MWQKEKVYALRIDGSGLKKSSGYAAGCLALIVFNHFHIKKHLNDAVDTVRKQELQKAREQNDTELSGMLHCNKRFILMQNKAINKNRDMLNYFICKITTAISEGRFMLRVLLEKNTARGVK